MVAAIFDCWDEKQSLIAGLKRGFTQTQDAEGNSAVRIQQEVNVAGGAADS